MHVEYSGNDPARSQEWADLNAESDALRLLMEEKCEEYDDFSRGDRLI